MIIIIIMMMIIIIIIIIIILEFYMPKQILRFARQEQKSTETLTFPTSST